MNVDEIIKLMQAVSENGLTSLELKEGELKLSLKREKEMPQIVTVSAPSADAVSMQMAAVQNGLAGPSMMSPAMMPQAWRALRQPGTWLPALISVQTR